MNARENKSVNAVLCLTISLREGVSGDKRGFTSAIGLEGCKEHVATLISCLVGEAAAAHIDIGRHAGAWEGAVSHW